MKLLRWKLRTAILLIVSIAVLMGVFVAIAPTFQGSNCGGNSAALNDVRMYSIIVRGAAAESPDHQFDIASATAEQRDWLSQIADDFWIRPGRFLVSPQPYRIQPSGLREVIIVCDTPYRNIPRRILCSAPPTHAAAFSDGTIGLISVAEFESLDHDSLTPLNELLASFKPQ